MHRVYLLEGISPNGQNIWRDFGIDYPSLYAAQAAADSYRDAFPHRIYRIRKHR